MICLGVLFDTVTFTMSVTPACLRELKDDVLSQWLVKKSATKTELQSLIGELAFVCKCVRPGRLFLTRLLDTLRSLRRPHHRIKLTADFKKHLCWWLRFFVYIMVFRSFPRSYGLPVFMSNFLLVFYHGSRLFTCWRPYLSLLLFGCGVLTGLLFAFSFIVTILP